MGRILHAIPSPDGSRVAISTHDNRVLLVRLGGVEDPAGEKDTEKAGTGSSQSSAQGSSEGSSWQQESTVPDPTLEGVQELGRSTGGEISHLCFSPDSRFLVWAQPAPQSWQLSSLMLADTEESEPQAVPLTSGKYQDLSPSFSADGKYLALLSMRTFETVYDDLVFDLGFVNAQRPFLIPLEATTADPFGPHPDGWGLETGEEKPGAHPEGSAQHASSGEKGADGAHAAQAEPVGAASPAGAAEADAPQRTVIDLESIEERIVPFPVESSNYSHLQAVKDGFIWLHHPQAVALGTSRAGVEGEAPGPSLELWSLKDRKLTVLAQNVSDVRVSGDGEHLVIKQGEEWLHIPAGRKVEDEDPARVSICLKRLRLVVDPVAERRGMLWDNYRIMAQQYWREDMDGQDWHAMCSWYDETVDRLVTDDDFQDMMWEVVGELGTSHAYVQGAPFTVAEPMPAAYLGCELERRDGDLVISRILPGDSSDPDARSPLLAPGVAARVGDAIVRVDGREVGPDGIEPLLIGSADRPTELVLRRDGLERRVVVRPLPADGQLRYQNWVATCRQRVKELSGGRLGYLHIPDMVSNGWAQMHRDLREASPARAWSWTCATTLAATPPSSSPTGSPGVFSPGALPVIRSRTPTRASRRAARSCSSRTRKPAPTVTSSTPSPRR